jgi:hypothetical protein
MALASWLYDEGKSLMRDAEALPSRSSKAKQTYMQSTAIFALVQKVLSPDFPLAEATGRRKGPRE